MRRRIPRIRERRLGREGAKGQCWNTGAIEIDPVKNKRAKHRLDSVCHELLHYLVPDWSERKIIHGARVLREALWRDNWRRVQK